MNFPLDLHTHLLTVAGSRAYGIHRPDSDLDLKGVAIPPANHYLGLFDKFEQADKPEHLHKLRDYIQDPELLVLSHQKKLEGTVFEIKKFCALALDCNPNILDVLFCREEDVIYSSLIGEELRENRDMFLSAKAKHTFSGYAMSQLKRIRNHRAWLLHPPKGKPVRADFGLPEKTLVPGDHLAAISAAIQKKLDEWNLTLEGTDAGERIRLRQDIGNFLEDFCKGLPEGLVSEQDRVAGATWLSAARTVGLEDNMIFLLQKEREWSSAQQGWSQYENWKRMRNPDRAALEEKYGYDTKHGAHLVRLLRMGREILEWGEVLVWRGEGGAEDADELRAIRAGAWSYDQIVEWAHREDEALNQIYRSGNYAVPKTPNRERVEWRVSEMVLDQIRAERDIGY
jgi:uncharacterized protein